MYTPSRSQSSRPWSQQGGESQRALRCFPRKADSRSRRFNSTIESERRKRGAEFSLCPPLPIIGQPGPRLRNGRITSRIVRIVLLIHRYDEGHLIPPRLSTVQTDRPVSSGNCRTRTTRKYVVGRKAVLPDHPTHVTQPVPRKEEPLGTFLEVELCTSIRISRISQAAQRGVLTPGCTLRTCIQC